MMMKELIRWVSQRVWGVQPRSHGGRFTVSFAFKATRTAVFGLLILSSVLLGACGHNSKNSSYSLTATIVGSGTVKGLVLDFNGTPVPVPTGKTTVPLGTDLKPLPLKSKINQKIYFVLSLVVPERLRVAT